ncbi:lipoate--protein ligase family protein [Candidatus Woesearchaeota archaeon]|nr:lipoate--protein ligase family protein [Candidatus Woesearchaeota archaeon]
MPKWRVIDLTVNTAAMNMALDEAISEAARTKASLPTIRFYKWLPSAVSIGYFQSLKDEVDVDLCKRLGVDFVRRRTGGGAVYHDSNGELTYSVIAHEAMFPKGITESYHLICGWIVDALGRIGIPAEFKPINDIIAAGKKISGNAQTRRKGVLLQHGTILYKLDVATMFSLLKVPKEKISDKFIADVKQRVTSVTDINSQISEQQLKEALVAAFTEGKEFEFGALTENEKATAEKLVKERYAADEWNFLR